MLRILSRMADEGLIVRNRGRGWSFVPSLEGVPSRQASYAFRLMIEPEGILNPSFAVGAQALGPLQRDHTALLAQIDAGTPNSVWTFETDARFHETIAEFSNNLF